MKKLITLFALLLISVMAFAQNPKLSFQAVVRDSQNKLVVEQPVTITVNVLKSDNSSQFEQTLNATTNRNGLMSLEIGDETAAWSNIYWEGAKIRTAVTLSNGNQVIDTSNVNAVPLALQTIRPTGVIIPQSDWAETDNGKNTFILNKPSIADTVNNILTNGQYVTTSRMNARISDTLSQYTKTTGLCNVVNNCDLSSNTSIANLSTLLQGLSNQMENMNEKMDSLNHLVDSLSNQPPVQTFICGSYTVDDHEGNTYNTVKIGNQCWTKENMRCTTSPSTGSTILDRQDEISYSGKKAYYYNNTTSNAANGFGLLYNWCAAVDTFNTTMGETSTSNSLNDAPDVTFTGNRRGICPQGWHVPNYEDWTQLQRYMYTQSEFLCGTYPSDIAKSLASTEYWEIDSSHDCAVGNMPNENNKSGFSALPAGGRADNSCDFRGSNAFFWSATQFKSVSAYYLSISNTGATAILNYYNKNVAYSVRCLRDGGITGKAGTNEMQSSTTSMSCDDVMNCLGDTLGKLNAKIEAQGYTITEQDNALDSLNHLVDSLSSQIPTPVYPSFTCGHYTVKDHEGNVYNTVRIGEQCWTKENMRCTTSPSTGTVILEHPASSYSFTGKKAYFPDGSAYNVTDYGLLYNWCATIDTFNTTYGETSTNTDFEQALQVTFSGNRRGICPQGWHVPSEAEWKQLREYMVSHSQYWCNGDSTYIAKALASSTGWSANSNDCGVGNTQNNNNTSGFTALPAGFYTNGFPNFGYHAHFWSAKQSKASSAFLFQLDYYHPNVLYEDSGKDNGASVRCLRDGGISDNTGDNEMQPSPTSTSCEDVMNCLGDTLGKLNAKIEAQNAELEAQTHQIDSLLQLADALSIFHPFACSDSITDADNNKYPTVKIGTQCWMAQNLRTTKKPDGTPLSDTDYYKVVNIDEHLENSDEPSNYGYLYKWNVMMNGSDLEGGQGLCPDGWHVPSKTEWETMTSYVKRQPSYLCGNQFYSFVWPLISATGWERPIDFIGANACDENFNGNGTNLTGFNAFPAGFYDVLSDFKSHKGLCSYFWSSSSTYDNLNQLNNSPFIYFDSSPYLDIEDKNKENGLSVRCIKD